MWNGILGHGKHLEDIASERALHVFEVDIREVWTLDLLRGIVHQNVNLAISEFVREPSASTFILHKDQIEHPRFDML